MISLFGTQFGFLAPATFMAAAVAGSLLLFYAYLRKGKSKKIAVASVMFLKFLEGIPRRRQKFLPPWRFFLELLLLLLLAASIAGLYIDQSADKITVLLDNSASMQAIADDSADRKTVFNSAIDKLKGDLLNATWGSKYNIYLSSPVIMSVTEGYVSASRALKIIENIKVSNFKDNLESAVEKLFQNKDFTKLLVFSDKVSNSSNSAIPDLSWQNLRSVSERTNYSNLALTSIRINKAGINSNGGSLDAVIQAFSTNSSINFEGNIKLSACSNFADCKFPTLLSKREFSIRSNSVVNVVFDRLAQTDFAYLLEITDIKKAGRNFNDALSIDNQAWVISDSAKSKIMLVSELSGSSLGLNLIPTLEITNLRPANYKNEKSKYADSDYSSIIFHRFVPQELPDSNLIFIMPPDNSFFNVEKEVRNVPVSRWKTGHDLLSYLNLANLKFNILTPFKIPNVLEPLIYTPQGIAAFTGELNGKRMAAFGFELFPYEGKKSPLLSVLTLNVLKWISEITSDSGFQRIDSPFSLTKEVESIEYLDGEKINKNNEERSRQIYFEKESLIKINNQSKPALYQAVRFYNPQESNISEVQQVQIANADSQIPVELKKEDTVTRYLAITAIVLLLLDLLTQIFVFKRKTIGSLEQQSAI